MTAPESLTFYRQPDPMTHVPTESRINVLLAKLPNDLIGIIRTVQNSLLHIFWAERYGVTLSEERKAEVEIRSAADMLRNIHAIDATPVSETRQPEQRLVGNCRDFTVLTVALLRRAGIPARARCGFGAYFSGPEDAIQFVDHWVVEYWSPEADRWVMVDAQLDAFQREQLNLDFDPVDVPPDRFLTGGAAWQRCRRGQADPDRFGIFEMHGLWFIRGDLMRDLAALNNLPLLPWDGWGLMLNEPGTDTEEELTLLDRVAEVTQPDTRRFIEARALYEQHEQLRVPQTFLSWMGGKEPVQVDLAEVSEPVSPRKSINQ
jgi:hypothetical protein